MRVWGENDSIHPQLENSETHVPHPSVPGSPPVGFRGWGFAFPVNNSLQCETEGRGSFLSLHPTQSDKIQFIFLEYQCTIPQ